MKPSATRHVLTTACLVSMTTLAYAETEPLDTELQKGPQDFTLTGELLNEDYDQGVVRNDNVTAHGNLSARFMDVGIHLDDYMAVGSDPHLAWPVKSGETTQLDAGVDYLIEYVNYFQILPHYQYIAYPNLPKEPYKDEQNYVGVDGWYELPWRGLEAGFGFDYNPFYNGDLDKFRAGGSLSSHVLRESIGAREFFQHNPIDLEFWQVLNMGNAEYKRFLIGTGDDHPGFTTVDIGVKYTAPFFIQDLWMIFRLEVHAWVDKTDRDIIYNAGNDTTDVVLGFGIEWRPQ